MKNYILIFVFSVFGCGKDFKNKIENPKVEHNVSLISKGLSKFEAVDGLGSSVNSVQFFQDSIELVSVFNSLSNSFHWFDLESGRSIGRQTLEEEGPNGVGFLGGASSAFVLGRDSIFIYNIQLGRLFLLDGESNVLERYTVTDYSDPLNLPAPFPSTLRPMQYLGGKLYLPSGLNNRRSEYRSFPSSLAIDLTTKKVNFPTVYPEIYSKAYWGEMFKYDPAVVPFRGKIVLSYPIDFSLHILTMKSDSIYQVPAYSVYFDQISPFKHDIDYFLSVNQREKNIEQENYSFSTPDFAGLLADPLGKYLYRIAYLRPSLEEVQLGNTMADFSVIVLDQELKVVGEQKFDGKVYDNSLIFTSPKGIHIFRKDLYAEDEQYLPFEVFQPIGK